VAIGDETGGVYPQTDSVTLLLKNGDAGGGFGKTEFDLPGYRNPNDPYLYSSDYEDSKLHAAMVGVYDDGFPDGERKLINSRELDDVVYGSSYELAGQHVWPLSYNEEGILYINNQSAILRYLGTEWNDTWWLRSPKGVNLVYISWPYGSGNAFDADDEEFAVRPAFNLNLSSVIFTSATAGGKSVATVAGGLVGVTAPTGTVKLTVLDRSQTLRVVATAEEREQSRSVLEFGYQNAPIGTNQCVSCVLMVGNTLKYYGKLADCPTGGSGTLSIPLSDVDDGTYTLKIFSEQANGNYSTDFAGEAVTMKVVVLGGVGTVSDFRDPAESSAGDSHICGAFGGGFGVLGGLVVAGLVLARRKRSGSEAVTANRNRTR